MSEAYEGEKCPEQAKLAEKQLNFEFELTISDECKELLEYHDVDTSEYYTEESTRKFETIVKEEEEHVNSCEHPYCKWLKGNREALRV